MENFSVNEVIELAIQIEKNGYKFYDEALKRKDLSSKAKDLLEELKNDEIKHEATFKSFRTETDYADLGDPIDWQEAASYLRSITDSHIFSKPDASIKLAASAKDEMEIINFAIQFEKDTLLFFFSVSKETTNEKSKKIIDAIIDEEVSHVAKLSRIKKIL
ncbi:MAG: ferritin family protein [Candidatus Cloacimonetes bacterium]|nr:ferritin family protein [Candidatus Cloacimonadota bacterium]MCF7813020.1 ferritin family protein [Candidatus Cloacimonadota bacterium]MCF7867248.1 ferritin family protein [Candidatus Cloacimonadota bacterium]MCF7882692.1 ferritin family protein [Candidatus Cloacimonadota bacterium]